jgi:hypothetical protein
MFRPQSAIFRCSSCIYWRNLLFAFSSLRCCCCVLHLVLFCYGVGALFLLCWCVFLRSVLRLLVTANVIHSSRILFTSIMKAIFSSKTSVLIKVTRRNIPEVGILQSISSRNTNTKIRIRKRTVLQPRDVHKSSVRISCPSTLQISKVKLAL